MADMDLDELLDNRTQVPNRPSRFAPKGSKFKPKPKPKTEPSQSLPSSASDYVDSLPVPNKEDVGAKPEVKPEFTNNATDMDIEVKPDMKEEERDDLKETEAMEVEVEREDEVVREIDVYFTPSMDPQTRLYVFQYPLRPLWRPYELDERCEEVRVKPASAEVEIDLAIDVDSKNYDSGADPRVQMKKQTLSPSWKPPHISGCAVGILTGNKLHLNPIHAVLQLRPSMHHLDFKESKRKTAAPSNVEDVVKLEEQQEAKPSGTSKKLSKASEQTKDIGENVLEDEITSEVPELVDTYSFITPLEKDCLFVFQEVWVPLKYHNARSDITAGYLQKMMAREGLQIYFSMSSYDYLNSLCPGTSSDSSSSSSKGPPRRFLLGLPLKERFKTWLCEQLICEVSQTGPPVHRFDALKYLAPDESPGEVLAVLQEHALLVQGLWVPKSSLVYGTDQGIDVLARDYVLLLFSKNVIINETQLPQRPQLIKAMKDVLNVLATERPAFNDWKLKELPDLSFIKSNPSVVKKQEEEWIFLEKNINSLIFGGRNGPGMKNSSRSSTTSNPTTSKGSNKLATRAPSASAQKTGMSEEVREAVVKALQKLFRSIKVCSFQQISQRLRDMAVSESARSTGFAKEAVAAANSIDASPDELQAIISQVAVNIHGICVPISSPDHKQFDPFRRVVIDLFLAEGPNAKLKKAPIIEAAKMKLEREIPQIEYQKVLQELCVSQGSAWVLRSADGNPMH